MPEKEAIKLMSQAIETGKKIIKGAEKEMSKGALL